MGKSTVQKTITLSNEVYDKVYKLAYQENRTVSNMIETLLLKAVADGKTNKNS